MVYFSRLTDIVTCNLSNILANEADPHAALVAIIEEMQEGLAGAKRSVATATDSVERLDKELQDHRDQMDRWTEQARQAIAAGKDDDARLALLRKQEVADVLAGLQQQHAAAVATREHLATTLRALDARLADAKRKQRELAGGVTEPSAEPVSAPPETAGESSRAQQVEEELRELKRQLGQDG